MRIMDLCDGDKQPTGQGLNELKWRDLKRFAAIISAAYNPVLRQFVKTVMELENRLIVGQASENEPRGIFAEYDKLGQIYYNNYRKLHHLPMRRQRCRWRPRESRRALDGLSPDVVVLDETEEW